VVIGLLAGALAPGAAAARAATVKPSPTFLIPVATSTIGGDRLAAAGPQVDLPPGTPPPPAVTAAAWLVADLDSGQVLGTQNAHVPLAPASTIKILTALALVPGLDPRSRYVAQDADAAVDGTKVGLVPKSDYAVDDLVHGLVMASGNDCATALATLAGGMPAATAAMSATARRLHADDTVVVNTSGLDAPGQVSSAYDLALLGRAALADPALARLLATTRYRFPGRGSGTGANRPSFEIQSHNRLLRNYEGATGVKNGYTVAARGSFVGSATRDGHRYVVTLVRAEGSTWHQAADLLDWAFAAGPTARPVGTLVGPRTALDETADPGDTTPVASGTAPATPAAAAAGVGPAAATESSGLVARVREQAPLAGTAAAAVALIGAALFVAWRRRRAPTGPPRTPRR
jgi:D-alanyl-D-alanine carboxypeptidase (penicillin-binding protein 5/6)